MKIYAHSAIYEIPASATNEHSAPRLALQLLHFQSNQTVVRDVLDPLCHEGS